MIMGKFKSLLLFLVVCTIFSCSAPRKIAKTPTASKDTVTVATPVEKQSATSKETKHIEKVAEPKIVLQPDIPIDMELVNIPGGTFMMGNKDANPYYYEKPKNITVKAFRISKTEITNAQYCKFLNEKKVNASGFIGDTKLIDTKDRFLQIEYVANQWKAKVGYENYPMILVTWYGADAYCEWAGGRLPTAAEWEYAAIGGRDIQTLYSGSENIADVAWFANNSRLETHKVGQKKPNGYGLFDMSGNVEEWCADWFVPQESGQDYMQTYKLIKGGSWASNPIWCQVWHHDMNFPANCNFTTGFRLVLPL